MSSGGTQMDEKVRDDMSHTKEQLSLCNFISITTAYRLRDDLDITFLRLVGRNVCDRFALQDTTEAYFLTGVSAPEASLNISSTCGQVEAPVAIDN